MLNGRQDLKVGLSRKELKKSGQAELVKLLPRLVSKGLGRAELRSEPGAVIKVVEGWAERDVVLEGWRVVVGGVIVAKDLGESGVD